MDRALAAGMPLGRPALFFWLFLLAAANKLAGMVLAGFVAGGWASAFNLFDISAILWLALAAGLALVRGGEPERIRPLDIGVAGLVVAAALIPVPGASAVALTGLAGYVILTGTPGSGLWRGAIIFLAMTGSLIWGPLFLELFSAPLLGFDASVVASLAGTAQSGNQIAFADGSGAFAVAPPCSSFHGMSLALVFWATVNQWFEVPRARLSIAALIAAWISTIAINGVRIAAIAHFPAQFDSLHSGWGAQLASWTTLLLVVAIILYGARRDVFAKA